MTVRTTNLDGTDWSSGEVLSHTDLNDTMTEIGLVPVGSIIAWHKSFANTPSLPSSGMFVECNGQTLSDAGSVFNGQTIPDLNSPADTGLKGLFLRGHTTSGATETSQNLAHVHTYTRIDNNLGASVTTGGEPGKASSTQDTGSEGGSEARPHNFSVVWIMRVK